jgi:hypothetical protein
MFDAKVALVDIIDSVPNIYNTNEEWVVKKMRSEEHANRIIAILPIIYYKDKVHYFNNKSTMMISKTNYGESINWATIMYS